MAIPAHKKPVKSIGVLNLPSGPKILTGSSDSTVKVWDLSSAAPQQEAEIPATGLIAHIDVNSSNNNIMWSTDEPLSPDQPNVLVGVVHLCNTQNLTTVPIKRSTELPYTHPQQVRSFITAVANGETFVITGGGEGNIRLWKFDAAKGAFDHQMLLEGHVRAVNALYLHDSHLWSASSDRTVRVWEVTDGTCLGVLSAAAGGNGHTDSVTCLEKMPAVTGGDQGSVYIASGGMDTNLKIWSPTGDHVHSCTHTAAVTAIKLFEDSNGGVPALIIGLIDGWIFIRSCVSLQVLLQLDSSICSTTTVWSIASLGQSCFASGGEDGQLLIWQVLNPLKDETIG